MAGTPLTHHEILALVEPFARSGRQVDLAATERSERRLAFKPRELAAAAPQGEPLQEGLILENPRGDLYRLTRTLRTAAGLEATLRVEGAVPDGLVERVDAVDPWGQFEVRHGVTLARSYRLVPDPAAAPAPDAAPGAAVADQRILAGASADLGGLLMTFNAMTGPGWPAEVRLIPAPGLVFDPPEDLLAVLGRRWTAVKRIPQGWCADVRVAKREPARTPDCERKLVRTLDHLVTTLGAPPARFHQRLHRARWAYVGRRLVGMLMVFGALAAGPLILLFDPPHDSVLRLLAFNSPNFLLFAWFLMRNIPSVRPPRIPAPLPATAWVPLVPPTPAPVAAAAGAPARAPAGRWWRALRSLGRILHPREKEHRP